MKKEIKVSDFSRLKEFLTITFNFFTENEICSCLYDTNDLQGLLEILFNSNFTSFSYIPNIHQYGIDFFLTDHIEKYEVYSFLFGNEKSELSSELLVDLSSGQSVSFMTIGLETEKHLPFVRDFLDKEGCLSDSNDDGTETKLLCPENEIMTWEELHEFLKVHNKQKDYTVIEVD